MTIFSRITAALIEFEVRVIHGIPEAVSGPLSNPVAKVAPPIQAKREKPTDDWRQAFVMTQQEGRKTFVVPVRTKTTYRPDGMESEVRVGSGGAKVQVNPELSEQDLYHLQNRGVSQKAGEHLKQYFAANPLLSASDLVAANGKYQARTCEGALAAFRAAAGFE